MSQGLKFNHEKCVAGGDAGEMASPESVSPPTVRVTFCSEQAAIWQAAETMRKSAETVTNLLVRTAVEKTRTRILLDANMRLLSCLDEKTTFSTLLNLFVPMFADGICIFTCRENALTQRAYAHADSNKENFLALFAESLEMLGAQRVDWWEQVLTHGRGISLSGQALSQALSGVSIGNEAANPCAVLNIRWLEAWPLVSARRVLGAVVLFGTAVRHEFDVGAGDMLQSLVDCASGAVANSEKYETARQSIRAREHLMAVAAHDLRNSLSLAVMSLSAGETLGEIPIGSPLAARIALVRKGLGRMQRLVDDLLDFSSFEAGRLSLVPSTRSVAALIEEVVEVFREAAAAKGIQLVCLPHVDGCELECDGFRLFQVFSNIVGNALKFTPKGGEITVAAVDCDPDIEFKISDSGSGISAAELPYVFEAYRCAKRARSGGLGLGLSIAKSIVVAHGGRIWGESRLGEGTTFFFRIPKRGGIVESRIQD